jgi:hypothetical protein
MPIHKLAIRPGVDVEHTPTMNEGGLNTSRLIRFFAGVPQKIGGWLALSLPAFIGTCRGLFGWADYNGVPYLAVGTEQRLYVMDGALSDITPVYATNVLTNAFTTLLGSMVVTIHDATTAPSVGDWIDITTALTVGGIPLQGYWRVTAIVDASDYQITTTTAATSSVGPTGNASISYLLPSGYAVNTPLGGYGIGDYGAGDYGIAGSGAITGYLRQWSLDQFGQDLIASPTGGKIYYWQPPTIQPATVVDASAPTQNLVVFVVGQAQIIVAAGTSVGASLFPTLVRWCDSGDFTDWVATATNQAGSFQLPTGSRIEAALSTGLGALIWTDTDLWSMVYQGLPFVFGFNRVGVNVESISQRAPVVVGNAVVWPSIRGFFRYDGSGVSPIECSVWDFFFNNIDFTQLGQVVGGRNTLFNEVAWWFPVTGGGIARIKWNYLENVWDYDPVGACERTAWVDHSPVGNPIGADPNGLLQQHEMGNNDNGAPIQWEFTTGYYDIADGDQYSFVDFAVPDFLGNWTEVDMNILATDSPLVAPNTYGPFAYTQTTAYKNPRVRARQVAFQFTGNDLDSFVRLGAVRIRTAPAGKR